MTHGCCFFKSSPEDMRIDFFYFYLFIFIQLQLSVFFPHRLLILDRERGREREREKNINIGEKHPLVAYCMPLNQGPNPQSRYVPRPGIKFATFWCLGLRSTN